MYRFLVVIEKANGNYSAYSPDLPGCVATGETREEVERNIHEAIHSAYSPDLPGCVATGETREEVERNIHEAIQMHVQYFPVHYRDKQVQ